MYLILEKEFTQAEAKLQQIKQYGTPYDIKRAETARDDAESAFVMQMTDEQRGFYETKAYMRRVNQAKWEREEAEERMKEAKFREEFPREAMKCIEKMTDRLDSLHIKLDNARNEMMDMRADYEARIAQLEQAAIRVPKVGRLRRLVRRLRRN